MNVSLTPELEKFIANKVSSGRYQTASEVVREGLRLLEEHDRSKSSFMVSSMEELRAKLQEGIDSLDRGEYSKMGVEAIIAEGHKQMPGQPKNG